MHALLLLQVPVLEPPADADGLTRLLFWLLTLFALGFLAILGLIVKAWKSGQQPAPAVATNGGPYWRDDKGRVESDIDHLEDELNRLRDADLPARVSELERRVTTLEDRP